MFKLKISSITTTFALAAIYVATLTSSGGMNMDFQVLEPERIVLYEPYIGNTNLSEPYLTQINSSVLSYGKNVNNSPVLIENISNELFGEMRYLTPEENKKKMDMYRKMSTIVEGVSFFE